MSSFFIQLFIFFLQNSNKNSIIISIRLQQKSGAGIHQLPKKLLFFYFFCLFFVPTEQEFSFGFMCNRAKPLPTVKHLLYVWE